ncbi:MAG TPA: FAD-binding oxidoreductase [Steroidobacteraceae bacterium]|jgi:FAD/FMN-containing dehydrogenase|nr:FAD-binding oxidoreductase [Steroidobacteraceae bacterium]
MNDESAILRPAVLDALRARLRGRSLVRGDAGYEVARRVWNGAIDRHPSCIVGCADAEDVSHAVRIAADHGLRMTVRGGGHNVAGRSICDGSLLLDLSKLRQVSVNREQRVATVQGGAVWRDVDGATAIEGLATTGGLISSTGVGGFTLGGGAGWLMRKHGLACDNLRSAGVVLADGRFVRASPQEHTDLYWGLRGGAGGLGVVTSFDFQLHPLREVLAGLIIHPAEHAAQGLRAFRDFAADAPDEFCGLAVIAHGPPLPFLDSAWHGRPVIMLAVCWSGEPGAGEAALAPLRAHGRPVVDHIGRMPYAQWQQLQDPSAVRGHYYYWKTANYAALSDNAINVLAAMANRLPTMRSEIHVQHMGGAVSRFAPEDSAFAHRNAQFFVNFIGITDAASAAGSLREGIRALHDEMSREALPGILANFADQDDSDNVRRFGLQNSGRLGALRKKYDPAGIFQGV